MMPLSWSWVVDNHQETTTRLFDQSEPSPLMLNVQDLHLSQGDQTSLHVVTEITFLSRVVGAAQAPVFRRYINEDTPVGGVIDELPTAARRPNLYGQWTDHSQSLYESSHQAMQKLPHLPLLVEYSDA